MLTKIIIRVPTQYWKYWKSIEFQNWFSRPWKGIEFGQNVYYVLKKCWNSKWKRNLKYLGRILLKAKQFIIYSVLINVWNWVLWLRISKSEEK